MPKVNQSWFNRSKIEYETPPEIFDPLNKEFGFTLDVCADESNHKCSEYFTREQNGLANDWSGVCWMNPPFGREMKKWIIKAYNEFLKGSTVVCLVPARTNTAWWHDYCMKGEVRFIRGEVTFVGCSNGLWLPMAIVIFQHGAQPNPCVQLTAGMLPVSSITPARSFIQSVGVSLASRN